MDSLDSHEFDWMWEVDAKSDTGTGVDAGERDPTFGELRDLFLCAAPEAANIRSFASFMRSVRDNEAALQPIVQRWPGAGMPFPKRVEAIVKKVLPQLGETMGKSIGPAR